MLNPEQLFTEYELKSIETEHPDGLSAQRIIDMFQRRGARVSEATFRKYVQLGLIPRSRRVGRKGKHKGSRGVYPPNTVRRINEIKILMAKGMTIEELQQEFFFMGGELDELKQLLERVVSRMEDAASRSGVSDKPAVMNEIGEVQNNARNLLSRIKRLSEKLVARARVARTAM